MDLHVYGVRIRNSIACSERDWSMSHDSVTAVLCASVTACESNLNAVRLLLRAKSNIEDTVLFLKCLKLRYKQVDGVLLLAAIDKLSFNQSRQR